MVSSQSRFVSYIHIICLLVEALAVDRGEGGERRCVRGVGVGERVFDQVRDPLSKQKGVYKGRSARERGDRLLGLGL